MEVIGPAVEGTKNVLEACAKTKGGVKRVVLTSSCAAIYCKGARRALDCEQSLFSSKIRGAGKNAKQVSVRA